MLKYRTHKQTFTTVSGAASFNTSKLSGLFDWIHIKPATDTTTFTLKMTDPDGLEIYESNTNVEGEVTEYVGEIPVSEVVAVAITGASKDELFIFKVRVVQDVQNR